MKHEFHNPDNLKPEQIGEGYRLLLKSEMGPGPYDPKTKQMEFWSGDNWLQPATSVQLDWTYRVPLSTWPLPEEEWKLKITGQTGPADMLNKCGPSAADFEPSPLDNDRWESLLRTNSMLEKRVKELEKENDALCQEAGNLTTEMNGLQEDYANADEEIVSLRSKLTAAQTRLEQLEWRPISVKPTENDLDGWGRIQLTNGDKVWSVLATGSLLTYDQGNATHWRPAALPTLPSMPDQSRVEFEKWWKARCASSAEHKTNLKDAMHAAWKAAKEAK